MTAKPNSAPYTGDAILVDHITKKYGDFTAVDDVSFNVPQGEIFGLLGPNGAGKSTLIRMMTTLLPITAGRALINGFDVAKVPDSARQCMGVIPQALTSDIDLTVEENLNIYAKLYGVGAEDRKRNIDDLLETVDLTKWRGRRPRRSPAACGAGWRSRADWYTVLRSSSSTSRPRDSIPCRASQCGRC